MNRLSLFLISLLCGALASCSTVDPLPNAQPGTILYGDESDEMAGDIIEIDNGNFLIVGAKENIKTRLSDIMVTKVDPEGRELWTQILKDDARDSYGRYIRKTSEGYAIVVIELATLDETETTEPLVALERYTDGFELISSTNILPPGGFFSGRDYISNFYVTPSGAFLLESKNYNKIFIQRFSSEGVLERTDEFLKGKYGSSVARTFVSNDRGGYTLAYNEASNVDEIRLVYFDSEGNPTGVNENYQLDSAGQVVGVGYLPDGTCLVVTWEWFLRNTQMGESTIRIAGLNGSQITKGTLDVDGYFTNVSVEPDGRIFLFGNSERRMTTDGLGEEITLVLSLEDPSSDPRVYSYGGENGDGMRGVLRASDGRYAIVGFSRSFGAGGSDATLIFHEP